MKLLNYLRISNDVPSLLHYSTTPPQEVGSSAILYQNLCMAKTISPQWGQTKATSYGRGFFIYSGRIYDRISGMILSCPSSFIADIPDNILARISHEQ